MGLLQLPFPAARRISTRGNCSGVGMLRLSRGSVSLHPGCAQHEIALSATEEGSDDFLSRMRSTWFGKTQSHTDSTGLTHSTVLRLLLSWCRRACSATSAPTEPQAERDACGYGASQLLSIADRNEASLLVSNLDHADGDRSCGSSTTASFTPSFGIPHAAGARSGSVAINYFCNRNDRLSLSCDGFSVN